MGSLFAAVSVAPAGAPQQQRPNIVIIWGDDIGQSDISAYSRGLMGFQPPHYYVEQSGLRLVQDHVSNYVARFAQSLLGNSLPDVLAQENL
jgi:arylsulfatase A-like enzyme